MIQRDKSNAAAIGELHAFYASNKLLVDHFDCRHSDACHQDAQCELKRGAEAHVGTLYGERLRVVVISLDTGGSCSNMDNRRQRIEIDLTPQTTNPHMKGTMETLQAIYGADAENPDVRMLFAMTNAAKCSRRESSSMVPWRLYNRCREYVKEELECLSPELIVTQGNRAHEALGSPESLSELHRKTLYAWTAELPGWVREWLKALAKEHLRTVEIGERDVPVIKAVHPSARGGQWQQFARVGLKPVAAMARHLTQPPSRSGTRRGGRSH